MGAETLSKLSAREPMEGTWIESPKQKCVVIIIYTVMEVDDWKNPIRNFSPHEQLPDDSQEAKRVRTTTPRFLLIEDQLYRTMGNWPLLICVTPDEGRYHCRKFMMEFAGHTLV